MDKSLELVSLEDVAGDFTWGEGGGLNDAQRTLYRDVMLETYHSLVSLGYCISKPEAILKLEKGAESLMIEEQPNQSLPGVGVAGWYSPEAPWPSHSVGIACSLVVRGKHLFLILPSLPTTIQLTSWLLPPGCEVRATQ
ncbi:PREDICTED: zinc finger protein 717-like isoform X2 [Galeopterus variegatus]|uniref:Zinc finger protein 717-like isoform X2 n=1 Tax=Galeopterus variegatus TaxID=482537 RepID=A0ABM0RJU2_GALVR|nr:PREDICTED: zinc finger protein 717-like isoform X2 [Galeopterus variegatus]